PTHFKTDTSDGTDPVLYVAVGTGNGTLVENLDAPGFVQTDSSVVLGGPLGPVSVKGGGQHGFQGGLQRDPNTGSWWLSVSGVDSNNPIRVGYYPNALFAGGGLATAGDQVFFGGRLDGPFLKRGLGTTGTRLEMGSGALPNAGKNFAAS